MKIDSKNYVKNVLRTESINFAEIKERLQNEKTIRLLHAALGLATEAGELVDVLKKHIFYGTPIDWDNVFEEVGDSEWYAGIAIDVLQTTLDEVLEGNIKKLKVRYPEKFNKESAENRNTDLEIKSMKKSFS